jgi:hypothetical protein
VAIDQRRAIKASSGPTKKYGRRGTNPPMKYPRAIVNAQMTAREPEGSGRVWWKFMRKDGSIGDAER